jgi:predicted NBD/HSP70 family sugar kinase
MQFLTSGTSSSDMKSHNISAILRTLLYQEGISRVHLAQTLGISTATITNLVGELIQTGLVLEDGIVKSNGQTNVGRPQKALHIAADARYVLGIHIDVGRVYLILANLYAQKIKSWQFAHALDAPPEQVLDRAIEILRTTLPTLNLAQLIGVGVAASGLVDSDRGVNVIAPNLAGWHNVPIRDYLMRRLNLPVAVDNNVRAMALGETLFGVGKQVRAMAFIYARTGVGAGLVVNGELYRGAAAGAGEIGHTTILPDGGDVCHCGNTGCLETLVSEPAILRLVDSLAQTHPELKTELTSGQLSPLDRIFVLAQSRKYLRESLENRARYMGIAIANLVNIFNPELIVLGGIFRREKSLLLPVIEATVRQRAFAGLGEQVRFKVTDFGDDAGMIGAAALALETFFYRPQIAVM